MSVYRASRVLLPMNIPATYIHICIHILLHMQLMSEHVPMSIYATSHVSTYPATPCNPLQHSATPCNTLQHPATPCNTLPHPATPCNTLQHHATLCNACNTLLTPYSTLQQAIPACRSFKRPSHDSLLRISTSQPQIGCQLQSRAQNHTHWSPART